MSVSVKRVLDPDVWEARQIDTLKAVGEKNYREGIKTPKRDPIKAGIAAEGAYNEAMRKVLDEELRKKGLEGTTMDDWYTYSSELGAGNLVKGVEARRAKVKAFVDKYQPMLKTHLAKIDAMSTDTAADRKARMDANLEGLKALHGKAR